MTTPPPVSEERPYAPVDLKAHLEWIVAKTPPSEMRGAILGILSCYPRTLQERDVALATIAALRKEVADAITALEGFDDEAKSLDEAVKAALVAWNASCDDFIYMRKAHDAVVNTLTATATERDELRRDAGRIDLIASEYLHVVPFDMPTGAGDADVGWRILQSQMGKAGDAEIAVEYSDDVRKAIDAAMAAQAPAKS